MAGAMDHLREATWLDGRLVRGCAALLAIAGCVLLANSFGKAMGPAGTDFLAFWGAGQVAAAGDPAAAYDLAVQREVQTATGSVGWFAFVNPPPFLLLAAPFGALPFALAWIAWVSLTLAVWAIAAIRAFPRLWPVVLVFPGAFLAAGHAQTGLLTGALLVGGAVLLERRPLAAGALLGALVIKPHLALLVPLWLAAGGRWRALAATGASAAGLFALSWATFGTETLRAYPAAWQASGALLAAAEPDFHLRMASLYAQLRLTMPAWPALALHCLVALAAAALVAIGSRHLRDDPLTSGALALSATALASPYLFNYDLPFLILPLLWLVRRGLADGFRPYEKVALVALWLAPHATRAAALPLGVNLMPLPSLILLGLVWTRAVAERTQVTRSTISERVSSEQVGNLASNRVLGATERNPVRGTAHVEPQLSQLPSRRLDAAARLSGCQHPLHDARPGATDGAAEPARAAVRPPMTRAFPPGG